MLVPLSWLRDFAPFDLDPAELGLVFDDLGMVVEGIERIDPGLDGVVVAKILEIEPIAGLDRVRLTRVDAGDGEALEVACGAWNIEPGDVVPLATIGTTLPNGMTIGRRKLKSAVSNGMLCSAVELGLGDDAAGILHLDPSLPLGLPVAEALGLEADVVYDLAIEGNRPDANCIAGVARDAAARLGLPFTLPAPDVAAGGPPVDELASIRVDDPDLCPRFTVSVLSGVEIGPAPSWVQRRLALAGMRPINNVVDASNYVMLELGQPTHPYDLDLLPGRGLIVRRARPGETIRTLDGVDRGVTEDDLLICDGDDTPVGIAGVMGGESSEISDATRNVLLEAANFEPMAIAWTSKRVNLRTEASARFERGVDPLVIDLAVARFVELVGNGTLATGMLDDRQGLTDRSPILLRTARVNELLGTVLTDDEVRGYLERIGFEVTPAGDGAADVRPPSFRPDVQLEVDLVEEVGRHHGYANIPRSVPQSPHVGHLTPYQRDRRLVRSILVGLGIDEAQTPSLVGPGDHERCGITVATISAANAMIQEESILRASLLPGLLRSVAFNAARRAPGVRFFEIGNTWHLPAGDRPVAATDTELPDEREPVAVAIAGRDATEAKRVLDSLTDGLRLQPLRLAPTAEEGLHPGRTAAVFAGDEHVGTIGEVDPAVLDEWGIGERVAWVDLELVRLLGAPRRPLEEQPISRFPSSDIDLAFVVPEGTPAGDVEASLRDAGGDLLVGIRLFDVYRGDRVPAGTRSLAYRLRFNALDHTLTDEEVADVRRACIDAVESRGGATLRA
ncbi:MAG TPA: phenylalanine--tRNA ligase subunit beta [Acidimicrobiales bacterium]|nr:phenylalanine--tRNA ligase subunit beta [Acidimicrobiales bacterium]